MNFPTNYGPIWIGSGTQGFFGEGYWFHKLLWPWLRHLRHAVFVAKTTTSAAVEGNMELTADYRPKRLFPDCIHVDFWRGRMLNSVALSGPGIDALLATRKWQHRKDPFMISVMLVGKTEEEQRREARQIAESLKKELSDSAFRRRLVLQGNVSCPNVGADMSQVVEKALLMLDILGELGIPILIKFNLLVSPEAAVEVARHPACSGIVISNTAPFGQYFSARFWEKAYPKGSPLERRNLKYGGGGLSGNPLFPMVAAWVARFRELDKKTYVNAGGGIMHKETVSVLRRVGANSVSISSVVVLRPWRVPGIIDRAYASFGR